MLLLTCFPVYSTCLKLLVLLQNAGWKDLPIELLSKIASGRDELKAMRLVCSSWQLGFEDSVTKMAFAHPYSNWRNPSPPFPAARVFPCVISVRVRNFCLLEDAVSGLQESSCLQSLELESCRFGKSFCICDEVEALSSLRKLTVLKSCLGDNELWEIAQISQLASLTLDNNGISEGGLAYLSHLSGLTELALLDFCHTSEIFLSALSSLPLVKLEIPAVLLSDYGFSHIAKLVQLRELNLYKCCCEIFCNDGFAELSALTSLQRLNVGGFDDGDVQIDDVDLASIQGLPLMDLGLYCADRITDDGLKSLRNMPLTRLELSFCGNLTGGSFPIAFHRMPLTVLDLTGTYGLTANGLAFLANLPLTDLNLCRCPAVDDESLEFLKDLLLRRLVCAGCGLITDDSVDTFLSMPVLECLYVHGCDLSDEGIEELRDYIPSVRTEEHYCYKISPVNSETRWAPYVGPHV